MAKREYVVRIIWDREATINAHFNGPWLECLRYAGIATVHKDEEDKQVFDLHAPKGIADTALWAEVNANRMSSFGINAVKAPAWLRVEAL